MRFHEIISETIDLAEKAFAPLYYGTRVSTCKKILTSGFILGATIQKINGKEYRGVSTTRSPRFATIDYGNDPVAPGRKGMMTFQIKFVLDQSALRNRYTLVPIDWFATNDTQDRGFTKAEIRGESEEFVVTPKLPLAGNVVKILIFADTIKDDQQDDVDFIIQAAKRLGIPVQMVQKSLAPDGHSRHWDKQMRDVMKD